MNILIFGANGKLAKEFIKIASNEQFNIFSYTKKDADISSRKDVELAFAKANPDIVLNFAAYTGVDSAEADRATATLVNVYGPRLIASYCNDYGARLCHISTGFVFDGSLDLSKSYNELAETNPINKYGVTKLFSEKVIQSQMNNYFIVRTNWLFGTNNDFLSKMISLGLQGVEVSAIDDQYGSFTHIKDLAKFCLEIIKTSNYGIYNYTNKNYASPHSFISHAFDLLNIKTEIKNISCENFNFVAKRQRNLCLDVEKASSLGFFIPTWQESLENFLKENYIEPHN